LKITLFYEKECAIFNRGYYRNFVKKDCQAAVFFI